MLSMHMDVEIRLRCNRDQTFQSLGYPPTPDQPWFKKLAVMTNSFGCAFKCSMTSTHKSTVYGDETSDKS